MRHLLLAALLVTACDCDEKTPKRSAEHIRPSGSEVTAAAAAQAPQGTPLVAAEMTLALPAAIGEAVAQAESTAEESPLANGGLMPSAKRIYAAGDVRITVQVTDTQHAPVLREAILRANERQANEPAGGVPSAWKSVQVSGKPALIMHQAKQNAALCNLLVTDRVLLHVRVEPAENAELASSWAAKVPLEAITKLDAPTPEPPAPEPPPAP